MFYEEARELLIGLEEGLMDLERRQGDRAHLDKTFRAAHSLKGAAAMVGLEPIARFTNGIEAVLEKIRAGSLGVDSDIITTLLESRDHLAAMVEGEAAGSPVPGSGELSQRLTDLLRGSPQPAPRAAAAPAQPVSPPSPPPAPVPAAKSPAAPPGPQAHPPTPSTSPTISGPQSPPPAEETPPGKSRSRRAKAASPESGETKPRSRRGEGPGPGARGKTPPRGAEGGGGGGRRTEGRPEAPKNQAFPRPGPP